MADENYISDELQDQVRQIAASLQGVQASSNQMRNLIDKAASGAKITYNEFNRLSAELQGAAYDAKKFGNDLLSVGSSITGMTSTMARGDDSFKILNNTIDIAAKAVGAMAKGLGSLIGSAFGPLGKLIGSKIGEITGELASIAAEVGKFLVDIFDDAQKTFHSLAQIGAIGRDGVSGMVKQFGDLGVPMQTFQQMVSKNSSSLALLNGSVTEGVDGMIKGFKKLNLNDVDQQLRNLGLTTQEIGDTMVSYADLQRRLGNQRYMDEAVLAQGTKAYGRELDILAKLTGKSREQAQQAMNQALLNERFQAKLRQMQASGQTQAADELRKAVQLQTLQGNKQMAEAIMSASTGFFTTPEAQAAAAAMPGFISNVQGLTSGAQDFATFTQNLQDGAKIYEENFRGIAMAVGPGSKVTKQYLDAVNLATTNGGELAKAIKRVRDDVDGAMTAPDKTTENLTKTVQNLQETTANLQSTLFGSTDSFTTLMKAASEGLMKFTEVIERIVAEWNNPTEKQTKTKTPTEWNTPETVAAQKKVEVASDKLTTALQNNADAAEVEELKRQKLIATLEKQSAIEKRFTEVRGEDQKRAPLWTQTDPTAPQQLRAMGVDVPRNANEIDTLVQKLKSETKESNQAVPAESNNPAGIKAPAQPEASPTKAGPSYNESIKKLQNTTDNMQTQAAEIAKAVAPNEQKLVDAYKKAFDQASQGKPQPMTEETGKRLAAAMSALPDQMQTLIGETKRNGMYTRNA